jgi:hypothetical protein
MDKASLAYWFPILSRTGVRVPATEIVQTDVKLISLLDGKTPDGYGKFIGELMDAARKVANRHGAVFLRTAYVSGKHDWRQTCYVRSVDEIEQHVRALVEWSEVSGFFGLPTTTWAVRQFVPMLSTFRAFPGGMPIGKERRYFIENGQILCHHPYWPHYAIEGHTTDQEWEEKLALLNDESDMVERTTLHMLASAAAKAFEGKWSLDFGLGEDGNWWAIDMAPASKSFHWPNCTNAPADPKCYSTDDEVEVKKEVAKLHVKKKADFDPVEAVEQLRGLRKLLWQAPMSWSDDDDYPSYNW